MTGSVNLTFQLQNKPTFWLLDDVSVHNGAVEMLTNGYFETGSLSPWVRTDPYGPCNGTAGQVRNTSPHTGSYHLVDGSDNCPDLITQTFSATMGQIYTISFWSNAQASGFGISIVVTIS